MSFIYFYLFIFILYIYLFIYYLSVRLGNQPVTTVQEQICPQTHLRLLGELILLSGTETTDFLMYYIIIINFCT